MATIYRYESSYHAVGSSVAVCFKIEAETEILSVSIDTPRLHIRSMEEADFDPACRLLGDKVVMEKLNNGSTMTAEKVRKSFISYAEQRKARNPYDRMAVLNRKGDFLGIVALTPHTPGVAQLSGLGFKEFWKQGYGKEASLAIVKEFAPAAVQEGHKVEGEKLCRIIATARPDNEGSWTILEWLGMQFEGEREIPEYKGRRRCYSIKV